MLIVRLNVRKELRQILAAPVYEVAFLLLEIAADKVSQLHESALFEHHRPYCRTVLAQTVSVCPLSPACSWFF
jgi:hypothetical protein